MSVSARRPSRRLTSGHRTQEQRRAETRSRLLDATAACLADLGWAGLSTTEVARRAGVSRGAQQHHYRTKMELVTAALEHLIEQLRADYERSFAALPAEHRNVEGAIDLLWEKVRQPPALALLELALAGRTDESLRELSIGLKDRVIEAVADTFYRLFPRTLPGDFMLTVIRGLFALLMGLTLQNSLDHDEHGHQAAVLAQVKLLAKTLVPGAPGHDDTPDLPDTPAHDAPAPGAVTSEPHASDGPASDRPAPEPPAPAARH